MTRAIRALTGDRKAADERLLLAWWAALVPATLVRLGVQLDGEWLVLRRSLGTAFALALVAWIAAVWRERRTASR